MRNLRRHLSKLNDTLEQLPKDAAEVFVEETPIRTGNARKNTKLRRDSEIEADYPYANRLNEGYSRQARNGMTEPTVKFIRDTIRKVK